MTQWHDPCSVCGAGLRAVRSTFAQPEGLAVALVTDVPMWECPRCGERYLDPETVEAIRDEIEQRDTPESVLVPLYHFPRA